MLARSSLFSLITETIFETSVDLDDERSQSIMHCFPVAFLTEKVWKAVRTKHPFIIASAPHTIAAFKDLGYKSFHPYINESYDSIENDYERLIAIMDEVTRLCNMSDQETSEWLEKVHEITDYNYQKLSKVSLYIKNSKW
jgi:hypothetical protein